MAHCMIYPLKNAFMGFPYMSNFPQRMFANICDSKPVRHHLVTPGRSDKKKPSRKNGDLLHIDMENDGPFSSMIFYST